MIVYGIIAAVFVAFSMSARRLASSIVTAPMVFLAAGAALTGLGLMPHADAEDALHLLAEVTLVVLLFLDAAQIDQAAIVRRRAAWPFRMLAIGLPLAFVGGALLGSLLLPDWPLPLVALAAAILVPTDAALGQPVVTNSDVPERPRNALIAESGLNDGLALPLVLVLAAAAAPTAAAPAQGWLVFAALQVTVGPLVGGATGALGAFVLVRAQAARWTDDVHEGIGALGLAALSYLAATAVGGNGFIAAFCGGLGFGAIVRGRCKFVFEFTESEGQLLSWAAFLLVGAVLVPEAVAHLTPATALVILGSLVVVRPLAIWLSLLGSGASWETRLFLGWFGPRGLATAVFALLVADQLDGTAARQIQHLAINAVWISALLHGLTAALGARWYARRMRAAEDAAALAPVDHSAKPFRDKLARLGRRG